MEIQCCDQKITGIHPPLLKYMGITSMILECGSDSETIVLPNIRGKIFIAFLLFIRHNQDIFNPYRDEFYQSPDFHFQGSTFQNSGFQGSKEFEYLTPEEYEKRKMASSGHMYTWDKYRDQVLDEIPSWDRTFISQYSKEERAEIILAANFLNFRPMMDLAMKTIADDIVDLNYLQMRKYFGVKETGFTKEEEEIIKRENIWSYYVEDK